MAREFFSTTLSRFFTAPSWYSIAVSLFPMTLSRFSAGAVSILHRPAHSATPLSHDATLPSKHSTLPTRLDIPVSRATISLANHRGPMTKHDAPPSQSTLTPTLDDAASEQDSTASSPDFPTPPTPDAFSPNHAPSH